MNEKKQNMNEYNDTQLFIDDEISQRWCRVIESIIQDTVQEMIRSIWVEQYAEVEIIAANAATNTVTCRNIQSGEVLSYVPNYSNIYITDVLTDKSNTFLGVVSSTGKEYRNLHGRVFMTNISDNPYYLGIWYDEREVK